MGKDLCRCNLRVLDDPDKLKPADGLLELIYGVLDERFTTELNIITTNSSGPELERRRGPAYGPSIMRRMREFCLAIRFDP